MALANVKMSVDNFGMGADMVRLIQAMNACQLRFCWCVFHDLLSLVLDFYVPG